MSNVANRHEHFLNSTRDMGIMKQQRHAILPFLRFDTEIWNPPPRQSRPPVVYYVVTIEITPAFHLFHCPSLIRPKCMVCETCVLV